MPSITNGLSYQQGYTPSFDDERRVSDILRNRNPMLPGSNPFGSNNAKVDEHDLSIPANRKSVFGQRIRPDPTYSRLDFGGSLFHNPFSDVNRFASNFDSDLHSYKALTVHNEPFEIFSRPILVHDESSKSKPDFGFWNDPTKYRNAIGIHFDQRQKVDQGLNQGFFSGVLKGPIITARTKQNGPNAGNYNVEKGFRPIVGNPYAFEANKAKIPSAGFKDISETWNPGLLTAFRSFGARIRETARPKCKYTDFILQLTVKSVQIIRLILARLVAMSNLPINAINPSARYARLPF